MERLLLRRNHCVHVAPFFVTVNVNWTCCWFIVRPNSESIQISAFAVVIAHTFRCVCVCCTNTNAQRLTVTMPVQTSHFLNRLRRVCGVRFAGAFLDCTPTGCVRDCDHVLGCGQRLPTVLHSYSRQRRSTLYVGNFRHGCCKHTTGVASYSTRWQKTSKKAFEKFFFFFLLKAYFHVTETV